MLSSSSSRHEASSTNPYTRTPRYFLINPSPEEKEACFAHRVAGHFSVDLVRAAAVTATALLVSAVLARIITREKNV